MNKVYAHVDDGQGQADDHPQGLRHAKSKRTMVSGTVEESREIQRMQHLVLNQVENIQFAIDGAVGLPFSTTASRVTARLLDHNRKQIGEPSASAVCHPDSPVFSPLFDLHAVWRGK